MTEKLIYCNRIPHIIFACLQFAAWLLKCKSVLYKYIFQVFENFDHTIYVTNHVGYSF